MNVINCQKSHKNLKIDIGCKKMLKMIKNKLKEFFWMLNCKGYISFKFFKRLFYNKTD